MPSLLQKLHRFAALHTRISYLIYFTLFNVDGCKNQADKRRIDVEAYLYSPQPMSSLQLINPFNLVTGLAVIACVCIIALFVAIFVALQVSYLFLGLAPDTGTFSLHNSIHAVFFLIIVTVKKMFNFQHCQTRNFDDLLANRLTPFLIKLDNKYTN